MKLYLVHCGYYETQVSGGIFESHVNIVVAAETFDDAKRRVRLESPFKTYKMHIDGIQEIEAVQGYRVRLDIDHVLDHQSLVTPELHRDL